MQNIQELIKNDIHTFVRKQRIQSGFGSNTYLSGYKLSDFELRAEKIPSCDFIKVIQQIASDEEIYHWFLDLQLKILSAKNTGIFR